MMGYKSIQLKLPTNYSEEDLQRKIAKELRLKSFTFQVENKSLDARKKNNIFWQMRVGVFSDALKSGDRVALIGFGSFSVSERSARTGRNPQTGKEITIAAKKVVKFKPGAELADSVS